MATEKQPAGSNSETDVGKKVRQRRWAVALGLTAIVCGTVYATSLVQRVQLAVWMARAETASTRDDRTSSVLGEADLKELERFSPRVLAAYFAENRPLQQRCLAYGAVARVQSRRPAENKRQMPVLLSKAALREDNPEVLDLAIAALSTIPKQTAEEADAVFAAVAEGPPTMARLRVMGLLLDTCQVLRERILKWLEACSKSAQVDDRIGAFAVLADHVPHDPLTVSLARSLLATPEGRTSRVYDALLAMMRTQPELLKEARDIAIGDLSSSDPRLFADSLEFLGWFGDFRKFLLEAVRQIKGNVPRQVELLRALNTAPPLAPSVVDMNVVRLRSIDGRQTAIKQAKPRSLSVGDSADYFDLLFSTEPEIRKAMVPLIAAELGHGGSKTTSRILAKDAVLFDPASRDRLAPLLDNANEESDGLVFQFFSRYCQIEEKEVPRFCTAIERNILGSQNGPTAAPNHVGGLMATSLFKQLLTNHAKNPRVVALALRILDSGAEPTAVEAAGQFVIVQAADPAATQRAIEAAFRRAVGLQRAKLLGMLESSLARSGGFQDPAIAKSACQLKFEQLLGLLGRPHPPENWMIETDGVFASLDPKVVREGLALYLAQVFAAKQVVSREAFANGIAGFKKHAPLLAEFKLQAVAALRGKNAPGRASALNALAAIKPTEKPIQDAIVAALNDSDTEVVEAAMSTVATLGLLRSDVLAKLLALAAGPGDDDVRIHALESLASLAPYDLQTVTLVNRLANDESNGVRIRAEGIIRKNAAR